jgi:hypothetical protein
VGLKLNGTYQLLVFTDDLYILGDKMISIKEHTDPLIDINKEVGLEVNTEKTKYMLMSHHQNVGQNRVTKIANRSFENMAELKYLGTAITNQNLIQEKIKRRLNLGNAVYHLVQNPFIFLPAA